MTDGRANGRQRSRIFSFPQLAMAYDLSETIKIFINAGTLPLSRSVSRVQEMLRSSDYNAADLAEHMRTDPTLTARVMSVANSAFFSQSPCEAITDAVNRLGSTQLMRIFAQVLARAAMLSPLQAYGLTPDKIWRRAVSAAVGAELAAARKREDRSVAYMVGLLHEIGMLVINSQWARQYGAKQLAFAGFETEHSADERARYQFDQAALGGELLKQLAFPETVYRIVGTQYQNPQEPLARALYLGRLAQAVHCSALVPVCDRRVAELFDLDSKRNLDTFLAEVHEEAQSRIQRS